MGIYQKGCFKEPCHDGGGEHNDGDGPSFPFRTVNDVHVSGIFQLDRAFLQTSISLFLRHITAECPFINSTSLFDDLTRGEDIEQRWSYPLVYTACCLGARLSAEPHVVQAGNALQLSAHKLLSLKRLQSPSLSTIQALTCLSLYEFGAGNNTKGWLLSGELPVCNLMKHGTDCTKAWRFVWCRIWAFIKTQNFWSRMMRVLATRNIRRYEEMFIGVAIFLISQSAGLYRFCSILTWH